MGDSANFWETLATFKILSEYDVLWETFKYMQLVLQSKGIQALKE
jgi:hypothetical protein